MRKLYQAAQSSVKWLKLNTEKGTAAIEYGILAALIAIIVIGGVTSVGTNLTGVFQSVAAKVHS